MTRTRLQVRVQGWAIVESKVVHEVNKPSVESKRRTGGSGAGAGRQGARPPRSQVYRRILKYDKGTHDQTQAHRGIINQGQGNPAVGRESGGGPGDGGVGHLLAGPYSGELWGTPTERSL
eukprot:scaffold1151_cov126-Isochrysis_galbana.AAC.17